ncbi:hypothetical protein QVD17_37718 [Tagetes erecta]|uniref:Gelsolin-like domain-containing protein n=1 Tax=Tagetes erecta TaxID=13708 RepID=A0AAD8JV60_TARER|nr:hypothetical protein QVD17_37718 [Tagetes erecta]
MLARKQKTYKLLEDDDADDIEVERYLYEGSKLTEVEERELSDDDVVPDRTPGKLYSIDGGEAKDGIAEYTKSSFESDKCYLMDCGAKVLVWVGQAIQVDDRQAAMKAVEEFLTINNCQKATIVTRLIQVTENRGRVSAKKFGCQKILRIDIDSARVEEAYWILRKDMKMSESKKHEPIEKSKDVGTNGITDLSDKTSQAESSKDYLDSHMNMKVIVQKKISFL